MTARARQPVSRWKGLVAAIAMVAAIAAIVAGSEALRYPHAGATSPTAPRPQEPEPAADPRDALECPDPLPREGQERDTDDDGMPMVTVSSSQLYDCPQSFDGETLRYSGEVVGGVLRRTDGAWVHLNDDIYADVDVAGPLPAHRDYRGGNGGLGVFIPHELADRITYVGGPRSRGDVLDVVGTFHRVDAATGEVAILRATGGTVQPGEPLRRPVLPLRLTVAIVMGALMLVLLVAERRYRDRG